MKKLTRRYCDQDENSDESEFLLEKSTDIFYRYLNYFIFQELFYEVWTLDGGSIILKLLYRTDKLLEQYQEMLGSPNLVREAVDENIGYCFEYFFGSVSDNSVDWSKVRRCFDRLGVRYNITNYSNNGEVTLSISPYIQYTSLSDLEKRLIKSELKELANAGWMNSYNNDTDVFLKLRR